MSTGIHRMRVVCIRRSPGRKSGGRWLQLFESTSFGRCAPPPGLASGATTERAARSPCNPLTSVGTRATGNIPHGSYEWSLMIPTRRAALVVGLGTLIALTVAPRAPAAADQQPTLPTELETYIQAALREWDIPGAAI